MDRTAWIAVSLCVIALVGWEIYVARQVQPRPQLQTTAVATPVPSATPTASAAPVATASPTPFAEPSPSTPETIDTLANGDIELRLTNRGGAIREAVLRNHVAERGEPVHLNSDARLPIGAIVEDPASAALGDFAAQKNGNVITFTRASN